MSSTEITWDALPEPDLQRTADIEQRDRANREREESALWDRLPDFMRGHDLVCFTDPTALEREEEGEYSDHDRYVNSIQEADMIASSHPDGHQRPVLDLDFPAVLAPSTTPGHFHLYLDKPMSRTQYGNLLEALAEAEIIEPGYAAAAMRRGYSSARLPWVPKPSGQDEPKQGGAYLS